MLLPLTDASLFLKGLLIGFSIAAPVGPIGTLCITRSITQGQAIGLATGFGAASADAVYGMLPAFGLAVVTEFLIAQQSILAVIGGIFLWYLAYKTHFCRSVSSADARTSTQSLFSAFSSTFVLTLTNPMTILSFVAVFAALGAGIGNGNFAQAFLIVLGVLLGSALWWLILSAVSAWLGKRAPNDFLRWIDVFSASILVIFGTIALYRGVLGA